MGLFSLFGSKTTTKTETPPPTGQPSPQPPARIDMQSPVLLFSDYEAFTLEQCFEGLAVFGGTGSGKSSGSGRAFARAFMRAGFGGLVMCAKPEEVGTWRGYAHEFGRSDDLIVLDGLNANRFNFLEYELLSSGAAISPVNNAVKVLMNVFETVSPGLEDSKDPFWVNSTKSLLKNALTAQIVAYGTASLVGVYKMANSAASDEKEFSSKEWRETSFCWQTLTKMVNAPVQDTPQEDIHAITYYFRELWGSMDNKLRTNIVATLSSMIDPFMTGRLREMLCTTTNVLPEMAHHGSIIVLNMPLREWHEDGKIAQQVFKYAFQRATERRGSRGRPVFLWADEAQEFISEYDAEFQGTARSSRACTVYLTQNINGYKRAMGGKHPETAAINFLENLKTKIFHANGCPDTNDYAARLIGQDLQMRKSVSQGGNRGENIGENWGGSESEAESVGGSWGSNWGQSGGNSSGGGNRGGNYSDSFTRSRNRGGSVGTSSGISWNESWQETKDHILEPSFFRRELRTGGDRDGLIVDAVVVEQGKGKAPYSLIGFSQE